MNKDTILALVRHFLTAAGGGLATNGTVTNDELQQVVGALITIAGVVWSVVLRMQAAKASAAANAPAPEIAKQKSQIQNLAPLLLISVLCPLTSVALTGCTSTSAASGIAAIAPAARTIEKGCEIGAVWIGYAAKGVGAVGTAAGKVAEAIDPTPQCGE